jgi:hypothetical protein
MYAWFAVPPQSINTPSLTPRTRVMHSFQTPNHLVELGFLSIKRGKDLAQIHRRLWPIVVPKYEHDMRNRRRKRRKRYMLM